MKLDRSALKIFAVFVALIAAFWCGRATSPSITEAEEVGKSPRRSRARASHSSSSSAENLQPSATMPAGAGKQAITSARQLREIFKQRGFLATGAVQMALAKMNSDELEKLAQSLEKAQRETPNYAYTLEIQQTYLRWAEIDPKAAMAAAQALPKQMRYSALYGVLASIALHDPTAALNQLKSMSDPQLKNQLMPQILSSLATRHPDVLIHELSQNSAMYNNIYIGSYIGEWAMDDPQGTAEIIKKLPKQQRDSAIPQIAGIWASRDLDGAIAWVESLDSPALRNNAMTAILGAVVRKDPDKAFAMLDDLPSGQRHQSLSQVVRTLTHQDPQLALKYALAMPSSVDRNAALSAIVDPNNYGFSSSSFSRSSWNYYTQSYSLEQLRELSPQVPSGKFRNALLGQMGMHLASLNKQEMEGELANYQGEERNAIIRSITGKLSSREPQRALELYQNYPEAISKQSYWQILTNLAKQDPGHAAALAVEAGDSGQSSYQMNQVFAEIARNHPEQLPSSFEKIQDPNARKNAIESVMSAWSSMNPTAAIAWAKTLPKLERHAAISSAIPSLARIDPVKASRHVDVLLADGYSENKSSYTASQLGSTWGKIDPEAAASWASSIDNEKVQISAIASVVGEWAKHDREQTEAWIQSMPDGKTRDGAVGSYARSLLKENPQSAFQWANTVKDQNQKVNLLHQAVRRWKQKSPEQALAAVEQANISREQKDRLIKSNQLGE